MPGRRRQWLASLLALLIALLVMALRDDHARLIKWIYAATRPRHVLNKNSYELGSWKRKSRQEQVQILVTRSRQLGPLAVLISNQAERDDLHDLVISLAKGGNCDVHPLHDDETISGVTPSPPPRPPDSSSHREEHHEVLLLTEAVGPPAGFVRYRGFWWPFPVEVRHEFVFESAAGDETPTDYYSSATASTTLRMVMRFASWLEVALIGRLEILNDRDVHVHFHHVRSRVWGDEVVVEEVSHTWKWTCIYAERVQEPSRPKLDETIIGQNKEQPQQPLSSLIRLFVDPETKKYFLFMQAEDFSPNAGNINSTN